jgi:probable selenium-dependent hydroxylase accessory protein YqeC
MQDSFYRNFISENDKVVAFIGGGGKTTLIQRLSKDCISIGKKVVILSLHSFIAPLEANIVVTNDHSLLKKQISREFKKSRFIYLGKDYQKGVVTNFNLTEVKRILSDIPCDHVFIEADFTNGRSISGYTREHPSLFPMINRFVNILGADALNQAINSNWIAHQDDFWESKKVLTPIDIAFWIQSSPYFLKLVERSFPTTFFINKVENIYIENLAILLAKRIKLMGIERVIIGSVFNSNLHLIK